MEAMYNVMKPDGMHSDKGKKTVTTADVELGQPIESQGPLTSSQARKRAAEAEKRRPETAAGVAEMKRVALNDHTGGLHLYFYHTRPTDEFSFPSDRLEIMRYVVNKSPKYAFTVGMALRCQKTNERLLVIVNNTPGYATRQSLEQQGPPQNFEGEDAINRSNISDSKADVFITSSRPSIFGVNYHNTFHNDILLTARDNTATENRMGGRLWRIAQAPIDRRIEGEQLTICAFEIMATYLGQRCNRYPRKGAAWYEYDGQKMTDLGEFYSAIARTTILNPDLFSNMTPQFIRELAVS
ncbi:hypothetical protein VdG1_06396 [Verticillium dahliae VDG1]|nr:hypothetical protein VdG1_06396 [Verticillium dahliae VDG1]